MKNVFKGLVISITALGVGFGAMFGLQGLNQDEPKQQVRVQDEADKEATPIDKLISSVMNMEAFDVSGEIEYTLTDGGVLGAELAVKGDISEVENIALKGDIDINLNGVSIPAGFGYFDSVMYFDYNDNYFKLATTNLMDFMQMLPGIATSGEMPEELGKLDLNYITNLILGMKERHSPDGSLFFQLDLSDTFSLYVKTDSDYTFKGIRTDHLVFENGSNFYLNLDLLPVHVGDNFLVSPAKDGSDTKYQDFKPVLDMIKGFANTFGRMKNTIELEVDMDKIVEDGYKDFLTTTIDFSYNFDESYFSIDGHVKDEGRRLNFSGVYDDNAIYVAMNKMKLSIQTQTISDLFTYIVGYISNNYLEDLLTKTGEILSSSELFDVISKARNALGNINISETSVSIGIDTAEIGLDLGVLEPTITFMNDEIVSMSLESLNIGSINADIVLKVVPYSPLIIEKTDYVEFEPAIDIISVFIPYIESSQFRLEFDANVSKIDESKKDVKIDGGFQIDINNSEGYGETTIVDRNDYKHNIKLDMTSEDEFLFSYNNNLNGKFTNKTINEVIDLLIDVVVNPDDHFYELFGDIIDKIMNTPIIRLLMGDLDVLMESDVIDDIRIENNVTEMDVALDMFGIDQSMTVAINYHRDEAEEKCYINSISVKNLVLGEDSISFNLYVKDYDESLKQNRLDPYDEYIDFSDIRILLELGINTSRFEYWHFTAKLNLDFGILFVFDQSIDMDLKIRNNKGKVEIDAEFDIPLLLLANKSGEHTFMDSRHASIYYYDGVIYMKRVDKGHELKNIIFRHDYVTTYSEVMTSEYFLDNVLKIVLGDMMGLYDSMMEKIINTSGSGDNTGSATADESKIIHYENILNNFSYNKDNQTFLFDTNLGELTKVDMLKQLSLYVYSDDSELTGLKVKLSISVLITISVDLDIKLADKDYSISESNRLLNVEQWVADRANDPINEFIKVSDVEL